MPLNDYLGSCGNLYEESSTESYIPCPCGQQDCLAEWVVLPRSLRTRNQNVASFVYFENEQGHVLPAPATYATPPNGYTRREALDIPSMRKLETRMNRQELDLREQFTEREQAQREFMISEERRDLRAMMPHMSEFGKDFAREAMRRNDNRRTVYDHRKDPGVHIDILHNDERRSNSDHHD